MVMTDKKIIKGDQSWQKTSTGFSKEFYIDRRKILLSLKFHGKDLLVNCYGGDLPHIGAVAIAIPRPSLADPGNISATVSVYTVTGHKDDCLASRMAKELSSAINKIAVVVVGIHYNQADTKLIGRIKETVLRSIKELIKLVRIDLEE